MPRVLLALFLALALGPMDSSTALAGRGGAGVKSSRNAKRTGKKFVRKVAGKRKTGKKLGLTKSQAKRLVRMKTRLAELLSRTGRGTKVRQMLRRYPKYLVRHLFHVAKKINPSEQRAIIAQFVHEAARARSSLKAAIARGDAVDPAKLPSDWMRDPWAYLYVDMTATDRHGQGNFDRLASMLDYYERMGVKNLYLLPHYESPMEDGGYDVSDHTKARKSLGGDAAFDRFMGAANKKGMRVTVDFIPGHVSERHALFQMALQGDENAMKMFIHEPGKVRMESYKTEQGELRNKYFHPAAPGRPEKVSDRLLLFPDAMNSNYIQHSIAKKKVSFYSTFYPFQKDFDMQRPEVLGLHMRTLGHWLSRGVVGIRADAIDWWVKVPGTPASGSPEAHAIAELFNAFTKFVNPKSAFLPEAVVGLELTVGYLGRPTKIAGTETGSEANMTFGFEEAAVIKHAIITGDFEGYRAFMKRKEKVSLPKGTTVILPIHKHDEWEIGFVPQDKRAAFRAQIKKAGGHVYKNGFSGGIRLFDLLDRDSARIKQLFKFFHGHHGTPATYYGDELGAKTSWPYAWKQARQAISRARKSGELEGKQARAVEHALSRQDPRRAPQSQLLEPYVDARNAHRGRVSKRAMDAAMAGKNEVFNAVSKLGGIRSSSRALSRGGTEEPLTASGSGVGSFMRRYRKGGKVLEEVAVIANTHKLETTVSLSLTQLSAKGHFKLVELESGRNVPFARVGQNIVITMAPHEVMWLRVDAAKK